MHTHFNVQYTSICVNILLLYLWLNFENVGTYALLKFVTRVTYGHFQSSTEHIPVNYEYLRRYIARRNVYTFFFGGAHLTQRAQCSTVSKQDNESGKKWKNGKHGNEILESSMLYTRQFTANKLHRYIHA
jgi:hypothetical protein